jgi:predicted  nucleic acid-binding Zn-ribbon protein
MQESNLSTNLKEDSHMNTIPTITTKIPGSNKQVMKLNKTIKDLKKEVETKKKTQSKTTLEIETLGKKSGNIDASIRNSIQEMEERISDAEDSIENMDTIIKENAKIS